MAFAMLRGHIVHNPGDQMVLKCAFNYLVQKIGCQQFVDVSPRKMGCERLVAYVYKRIMSSPRKPHDNIIEYPIFLPQALAVV
jgi:hypothetical protein